MIRHPAPGRVVRARYNARVAGRMPLHGRVGVVVAAAPGPGPRSVLVDFGWAVSVVPPGVLVDEPATPAGGGG